MNREEAINRLIRIAEAEIGYLEKETCGCLDDKTANAGNGNYTKYWRDIYPASQGEPWCAAFVSWCMMRAFGKEDSRKLLRHWPYVYCPTLAGLFEKHTHPERGDIVLFIRKGIYAHTSLAVAISGSLLTTIEGNTSGQVGVIPNGGGVFRKEYDLSETSGIRFVRPAYEILCKEQDGQKTYVAGEQSENVASGTLSRKPFAEGIVTASTLNVRKWAGTEYPQISSFPVLPHGAEVEICDKLQAANGCLWYYVRIHKRIYGFVCADYITSVF